MSKSFEWVGMDEYIAQLEKLTKDSEDYIKKAVREGADVAADEMRSKVNALAPGKGITQDMLAGLRESFGITPVKNDNGFINAKIGFDGYNARVPYKVVKGHWVHDAEGIPNQYVANIIEKGCSYRSPHKFSNIKAKLVEQALQNALDEQIKKIVK